MQMTVSSCSHQEKALLSIDVSVDGKVMECILVQNENTQSSMVLTFSGISKCVRPVQLKKVLWPMVLMWLLELYLGQLGAVIKGSPAQRGHRRGYLYTLQATGGKHTAVNSSDTTAEVD